MFILKISRFKVLVDSKKYDTKVGSSEREKMLRDMEKNKEFKIGWLISLDSRISARGDATIIPEIVGCDQILFYVNNLMGQADPSDILNQLYHLSDVFRFFLLREDEEKNEFQVEKEKKKTFVKQMQAKRDEIRKLKANANSFVETILDMEASFVRSLEDFMSSLRSEFVDTMNAWWMASIKFSTTKSKGKVVSSSSLWDSFKKFRNNAAFINDYGVNISDLKIFVKGKVSEENVTYKDNTSTIFFVEGISFVDKKLNLNEDMSSTVYTHEIEYVEEIVDEDLGVSSEAYSHEIEYVVEDELGVNNEISPEDSGSSLARKEVLKLANSNSLCESCLKKKSKCSVKLTVGFCAQVQEEYNAKKTIMEVSKSLACETSDIQSVLVNHGIEEKRTSCRGYEEYKLSDEYKEKCRKNNEKKNLSSFLV
jgi:hypothetical protein